MGIGATGVGAKVGNRVGTTDIDWRVAVGMEVGSREDHTSVEAMQRNGTTPLAAVAETALSKITQEIARINFLEERQLARMLLAASRTLCWGRGQWPFITRYKGAPRSLRACLRSLKYVKLRPLSRGVIMSHSYPSDISREQFARILPTLESARRRTKPRTVDLYDVFCGVLYLLKAAVSGACCP